MLQSFVDGYLSQHEAGCVGLLTESVCVVDWSCLYTELLILAEPACGALVRLGAQVVLLYLWHRPDLPCAGGDQDEAARSRATGRGPT